MQHSFCFQSDYHQQTAQQHKLGITQLLTTVIDLWQEKYQAQEQQATSAQNNLTSLQSAYSVVKAQNDSALAAQAAAEQRLAASSSELNALQTRHATQQAELSSVSAERDRLTQAGTTRAAELSQTQRDLSTSQVQLENSREQHKQVQEKLTAHEAGLTQLQQQHYQTGDSARGQTHATR
jgi:chromosome segregation ATPase